MSMTTYCIDSNGFLYRPAPGIMISVVRSFITAHPVTGETVQVMVVDPMLYEQVPQPLSSQMYSGG